MAGKMGQGGIPQNAKAIRINQEILGGNYGR